MSDDKKAGSSQNLPWGAAGVADSAPLRIIIAGGGTGGHIFPAIAIANAIKKLMPEAEILFVGAKGKMEMEKVPLAGYKIKGLYAHRLTIFCPNILINTCCVIFNCMIAVKRSVV